MGNDLDKLVGKKIRQIRESFGETQAEFGDRFGVEQATVSRWEKGRPVERKHQKPLADLAKMSVGAFFHSHDSPRIVPVIGKATGVDTFEPADPVPNEKISHVTLALGEDRQVAVQVEGNGMSPVYRDGDILIGTKLSEKSTRKAINQDCIVMTTKGKGYVKKVTKGSKNGCYRLRSYNHDTEDLIDVELEWAAPILWVKRQH